MIITGLKLTANIEVQSLKQGDYFTTDGEDVLLVLDEKKITPREGKPDIVETYCAVLYGEGKGMLCYLAPLHLVSKLQCLAQPVFCTSEPQVHVFKEQET